MAEFDRGVISKYREVIVKHTLYTNGITNAVSMGELVRCKDCRYYASIGYCALHQTEMCETDFCSYGKKDDDNG